MSVDIYPHLPGYRTTLRDGHLKFAPPSAATQSVLLIGTALDGPGNDPRRPMTLAQAEMVYDVPSPDFPLVLGWQEAIDAGCEDVRLVRLPGNVAEISVDGKLLAKGRYSGTKYNGIDIVVSASAISFEGLEYDLETDDTTPVSKTLDELIQEMNTDPENIFVRFELEGATSGSSDATDILTGTSTLTGGTDAPANLKTALTNLYELLVDYEVDMVVVLGAYADDGEGYAEQLAEQCATMSQHNRLTVGFMATSPLDDTSLAGVASYYNTVKDLDLNLSVAVEGTTLDGGRYLCITIGDLQFRDRTSANLGLYSAPGAAATAALASTLPSQSAITNKTVPGARSVAYRFSMLQLNELSGKGFITFRPRAGRGVVVVDGPTSADRDSDYVRLSTVRIVGDITAALVAVAEPFIGEPSNQVSRNALHTAVKNVLDSSQETGAIQQYVFTIQASPAEMVQGILNIMLEIVPAFELRKIRTVITLRPEL